MVINWTQRSLSHTHQIRGLAWSKIRKIASLIPRVSATTTNPAAYRTISDDHRGPSEKEDWSRVRLAPVGGQSVRSGGFPLREWFVVERVSERVWELDNVCARKVISEKTCANLRQLARLAGEDLRKEMITEHVGGYCVWKRVWELPDWELLGE